MFRISSEVAVWYLENGPRRNAPVTWTSRRDPPEDVGLRFWVTQETSTSRHARLGGRWTGCRVLASRATACGSPFLQRKRTTLRPKRTSMGGKAEKLNFQVHVKDSVRVPSRRASQTRHWDSVEIIGRSVADTVVEELAASCIWKKKTNASESEERSRLSLSVLQI